MMLARFLQSPFTSTKDSKQPKADPPENHPKVQSPKSAISFSLGCKFHCNQLKQNCVAKFNSTGIRTR